MKTIILTLLLAVSSAHAQVEMDKSLPDVNITDKGQMVIEGDKFNYQAWSSKALISKVFLIQHIAGRTSAKELNAGLIKAIKQAKFPKAEYQTVNIINLDDAIWGTGSFVESKTQDSKKTFPWSSFILDENSTAKKRWQLADNSSAIIVLDQHQKVVFFKDGQLDDNEVSQVIKTIDSLIQGK